MANDNIPSYLRYAKPSRVPRDPRPRRHVAKPAHLCSKRGCENERYFTNRVCYAHLKERLAARKKVRSMTQQEAWLNDLAQTEAFSGLVTIWHEGADSTLSGFTALLPDVGRMAFVGSIEVEGE